MYHPYALWCTALPPPTCPVSIEWVPTVSHRWVGVPPLSSSLSVAGGCNQDDWIKYLIFCSIILGSWKTLYLITVCDGTWFLTETVYGPSQRQTLSLVRGRTWDQSETFMFDFLWFSNPNLHVLTLTLDFLGIYSPFWLLYHFDAHSLLVDYNYLHFQDTTPKFSKLISRLSMMLWMLILYCTTLCISYSWYLIKDIRCDIYKISEFEYKNYILKCCAKSFSQSDISP